VRREIKYEIVMFLKMFVLKNYCGERLEFKVIK